MKEFFINKVHCIKYVYEKRQENNQKNFCTRIIYRNSIKEKKAKIKFAKIIKKVKKKVNRSNKN